MKKIMSILALCMLTLMMACGNYTPPQQTSDSGIKKASVKIAVDPKTGMSIEQSNVEERLKRDNEPGAIKHLYIISPFSGQCLFYSTVKGKVTSGNKRLSPASVNGNGMNNSGSSMMVNLGGERFSTNEVIDDGGTYGSSLPYIFWFDAKGHYQQYFPTGSSDIFISDQPIQVKSVAINLNN